MIYEYSEDFVADDLLEGDKVFTTRILKVEVPVPIGLAIPRLDIEFIFVARIDPCATFKVYWMTWGEMSISSGYNNYTGANYAVNCTADHGSKIVNLDHAEAIFPLLKAAGYRAAL